MQYHYFNSYFLFCVVYTNIFFRGCYQRFKRIFLEESSNLCAVVNVEYISGGILYCTTLLCSSICLETSIKIRFFFYYVKRKLLDLSFIFLSQMILCRYYMSYKGFQSWVLIGFFDKRCILANAIGPVAVSCKSDNKLEIQPNVLKSDSVNCSFRLVLNTISPHFHKFVQ